MNKHILQGITSLTIIVLVGIAIWQYLGIKKLNSNINKPPSPFSYHYYDAGDKEFAGGYVSAKGTWESNLKLAYPYNINQVDCWKQWKTCVMTQAYTTGDKSIGGLNMINTDINYYDIESWDISKIIAKNSAMCAETILTFDRTSKKITTITTPINTETEECKSGEKLLGAIEVQTNILTDGSKKWIDEFITNKK